MPYKNLFIIKTLTLEKCCDQQIYVSLEEPHLIILYAT